MKNKMDAMNAITAEERSLVSPEEEGVLKRFAAGDIPAFEILFHQHQARVYAWIVRIVRDAGIAEDLTIETFWRIYRARKRFDPARGFGPWARRIATNVAINGLKNLRPEERLSTEALPSIEVDSDLQRHIRKQTERAFRQLPARFQAVAIMALVDERPYEEISQALGISMGAVKTRVFRAVRLLRVKLKQLGVEP